MHHAQVREATKWLKQRHKPSYNHQVHMNSNDYSKNRIEQQINKWQKLQNHDRATGTRPEWPMNATIKRWQHIYTYMNAHIYTCKQSRWQYHFKWKYICRWNMCSPMDRDNNKEPETTNQLHQGLNNWHSNTSLAESKEHQKHWSNDVKSKQKATRTNESTKQQGFNYIDICSNNINESMSRWTM